MKNLLLSLAILLFMANTCFADTSAPLIGTVTPSSENQEVLPPKRKHFTVSLYKTNYVMPFYYNPDSNTAVYAGHTPAGQSLNKTELKFQFSLLVPIITDLFSPNNSLNIAYTQQSYWQAYNNSAFFRETNYEPEIFFARVLNQPLKDQVLFSQWNVGFVHQSNGQGGSLERSWNRVYGDLIFTKGQGFLDLKPWLIVNERSLERYNPDIRHYMGYGKATLSYKIGRSTISFMGRNWIESGFKRPGSQLSWSLPIDNNIRFYTEVFSGYGQSLIDYNHRTTSFGLGFALNDIQ